MMAVATPVETVNAPPGLENYVANAYNAKDGNFLSKPVFKLTYNDEKTISWGPDNEVKQIPDQISASTATIHYKLSTSLLLQNKADYDRSFSASVDAEYSGVTFSGSAQSSLLYHGKLFSDISSSYALNFYLQSVLNFERLSISSSSSLDTDFIDAVNSLPKTQSLTVEEQQKYFDFFGDYGTHYASFATMGGTIVMETKIKDSVFESYTSSEVTAGISAGYDGVIASGKLSVSAAYSSSSFLSDNSSSSEIALNVMGGLYAPDEEISDWVTSIYNTPSLLLSAPTLGTNLTTLTAISNLVQYAVTDETTAKTIADNINTLVHSYIMRDAYEDSLLTSPQDINLRQEYQASQGGGFVISTVQNTPNGNRGSVKASDNTNPNPTTMRATASQHYYANSGTWIPYASLTMPTPANTYYSIELTSTSSDVSPSLKFVGLGNIGEEGMGEWQTVNLDKDLIAPSDGFVLAYVNWNGSQPSRGYVLGSQQLSSSSYSVIAGASQHYDKPNDTIVPTNSFCMPIRKNTKYKVDFTKKVNSPIAQAFFVPFSEKLVFSDELQTRTEGHIYQAQSDGFLLAYIFSKKNPERGYVKLYSYPDPNELTKLGNIASTSIHYSSPQYNTFVYHNSAMIPVSKNNYYKAVFTKTWGNPDIKLFWIPLGIQS